MNYVYNLKNQQGKSYIVEGQAVADLKINGTSIKDGTNDATLTFSNTATNGVTLTYDETTKTVKATAAAATAGKAGTVSMATGATTNTVYSSAQTDTLLNGKVSNTDYNNKVAELESAISDLEAINANHYQATATGTQTDTQAIDIAVGPNQLHDGDTAVVIRDIAGTAKSYTAYVYDGNVWQAMDGNYDASNVYFKDNLTYTAAIGVLSKPSSGSAQLAASGKSLEEVLKSILATRETGTITANPSVSATTNPPNLMKSYEVGTRVTPKITPSFSAGSYKFGPTTGVTVTAWKVEAFDKGSSTAVETKSLSSTALAPGEVTMSELLIEDNTSYKLTATATHTAGVRSKSNLGDQDSDNAMITAGSKSTTKQTITGYRSWFIGSSLQYVTSPDSAFIRGNLTNSGDGKSAATVSSRAIPLGAKTVIVAIPTTSSKQLKAVYDLGALNATVGFTKLSNTVAVAGASADVPTQAYNVWIFSNPDGVAATNYKFEIA